MPGLIPLALFVISLLFFVGGYFFSSTFYFHKHQVKYSFKRMFPYEFNYPSSFKNNIYGNIAFIVAILSLLSFYIYWLTINGTTNVTNIMITALAVSMAGFICCLFFMPLQFLRTHMIISTLAMVISLGIPAMVCFAIMAKYRIVTAQSDQTLCIVGLVLSALLALTMLVFILNPKATYKIYLEKSVNENGQEVMARPKFIPMAFNEWWSIVTFFLSPIGLVIISFIK